MSLAKERHQETGHRLLVVIGCTVDGKLFDEETCKFHEHYDAAKGTFAGLPVRVCEYQHLLNGVEFEPKFVVGAYVADLPYTVTLVPPELISREQLDKYCKLVRETLEPLGFWDERRFGLWVFS